MENRSSGRCPSPGGKKDNEGLANSPEDKTIGNELKLQEAQVSGREERGRG